MKTEKIMFISLITIFFTSCLGDKKNISIEEANDSTSFVNEDFKGNLIDYDDKMSACSKMNEADLAKLYNVPADKIYWMDSATNERMQTTSPTCNFRVMIGENEFNYLSGGITVQREIKKDEMMGEIAEAAGGGENWKEAWALKKSISKSAEWVENVGEAALWYPNKRQLLVKFDGYTLTVIAPGASFNEEEKARNRDYKKIALEMARKAGFIN
jgi:hypothetical protein